MVPKVQCATDTGFGCRMLSVAQAETRCPVETRPDQIDAIDVPQPREGMAT
jgi:hypothetical protein